MVSPKLLNLDPYFGLIKRWMLHRGLIFLEEISIKPPAVALLATREDLRTLFYQRERKDPQHSVSGERINPLAFYCCSPGFLREVFNNRIEKAIFITSGFNAQDPRDLAVLVHEFVHFLQDIRGRWESIYGTIMESEALIIEELFRRDFGLASISDEIALHGHRFGS